MKEERERVRESTPKYSQYTKRMLHGPEGLWLFPPSLPKQRKNTYMIPCRINCVLKAKASLRECIPVLFSEI